MEIVNKRLDEHDNEIYKLKEKDATFDKFMIETSLRYEHLEKAITKKAEFWDKVKVSISTSIILFLVMWILNRSGIFV